MSYSDRLRSLNNAFKTAKPYGVRLPDGVYQTRVKTAKVIEYEKMESKPLTWIVDCEVLTPEKFAGRELQHKVFLESPTYQQDACSRLLTEMQRMGVDLKGDMSKLEKLCEKMPGMGLEIAVVASKKDPRYYNTYINSAIQLNGAVAAGDEPVTDEEAEAEVEEAPEVEEPVRKKPRAAAKPAPKAEPKATEEVDADEFEFEM